MGSFKDIIDLYSKIVIAVLGFVAPSMTLLLGVFAEGIKRQRKRNEEKIKQLEKLIIQEPQQIKGDNQKKIDFIKRSIKKHEEQKNKAQKDINLLSPKRQVLRIFGTLLLSVIFLAWFYFLRANSDISDMQHLQFFALILSLCVFTYSLFSLWQVFCLITELKQVDEADTTDKNETIKIEQEN